MFERNQFGSELAANNFANNELEFENLFQDLELDDEFDTESSDFEEDESFLNEYADQLDFEAFDDSEASDFEALNPYGEVGGGRIKNKKDPAKADLVVVQGRYEKKPLHKDAAIAWGKMVAAARADGLKAPLLLPTSGYRSTAQQVKLFTQAVRRYGSESAARKWVAKPGGSAHHSGRAMDLYLGTQNSSNNIPALSATKSFAWLKQNAVRFGFYPYPAEPWHWEYNPTASGSEQEFENESFWDSVFGGVSSALSGVMATSAASSPFAVHRQPKLPNSILRKNPRGWSFPLNETGQPQRSIAKSDPAYLTKIVNWLDPGNPNHNRYFDRVADGVRKTYCNIFATDYCYLAGVYLPRVWWKNFPPSSASMSRKKYGEDYHELNANSLFDWLKKHGATFGWRDVTPKEADYTQIQQLANEGHVVVISYKNPTGKSGHISTVVPEVAGHTAERVGNKVSVPLQSQAGARNFTYEARKWFRLGPNYRIWVNSYNGQLLQSSSAPSTSSTTSSQPTSTSIPKIPDVAEPKTLRAIRPVLDAVRGEIPLDFLVGWVGVESDGRNDVRTSLDERGYFQVHPDESKDHGYDHRRISSDWKYSITVGIDLVRHKATRALVYADTIGYAPNSDLYWRVAKLMHWLPVGVKAMALAMKAASFKPANWQQFKDFVQQHREHIMQLIKENNKAGKVWDPMRGIANVDKLFAKSRL